MRFAMVCSVTRNNQSSRVAGSRKMGRGEEEVVVLMLEGGREWRCRCRNVF